MEMVVNDSTQTTARPTSGKTVQTGPHLVTTNSMNLLPMNIMILMNEWIGIEVFLHAVAVEVVMDHLKWVILNSLMTLITEEEVMTLGMTREWTHRTHESVTGMRVK